MSDVAHVGELLLEEVDEILIENRVHIDQPEDEWGVDVLVPVERFVWLIG